MKSFFWWPLLYTKKETVPNKIFAALFEKTSRERLKSARYLRLKIIKRTSKCQVFAFTVPKTWTELARQVETLRFLIHSVANHQKNEREPLGDFFLKKVSQRQKTERGTL